MTTVITAGSTKISSVPTATTVPSTPWPSTSVERKPSTIATNWQPSAFRTCTSLGCAQSRAPGGGVVGGWGGDGGKRSRSWDGSAPGSRTRRGRGRNPRPRRGPVGAGSCTAAARHHPGQAAALSRTIDAPSCCRAAAGSGAEPRTRGSRACAPTTAAPQLRSQVAVASAWLRRRLRPRPAGPALLWLRLCGPRLSCIIRSQQRASDRERSRQVGSPPRLGAHAPRGAAPRLRPRPGPQSPPRPTSALAAAVAAAPAPAPAPAPASPRPGPGPRGPECGRCG